MFMHPFIHQILKPEGVDNTFKVLQYKNIIQILLKTASVLEEELVDI